MRAVLKNWSLVLLLGALFGNGQPRDQAQADDKRAEPKSAAPQRLTGEHELRTSARPGLQLVLKPGFEVRLAKNVAATQLVLRVAKVRAVAREIAQGFVPIGPTVELAGIDGDVDVSFLAEQFHVRASHQLVLARELSGPCPTGESCWQLLRARYEGARCLARAVRVEAHGVARQQDQAGVRLQFGSLPRP